MVLEQLKNKVAQSQTGSLETQGREIKGVHVLSVQVDGLDRNQMRALADSLRNIRDGEILLLHLGIWSRQDPYWPMLDPLLAGLKKRGFQFALLP